MYSLWVLPKSDDGISLLALDVVRGAEASNVGELWSLSELPTGFFPSDILWISRCRDNGDLDNLFRLLGLSAKGLVASTGDACMFDGEGIDVAAAMSIRSFLF